MTVAASAPSSRAVRRLAFGSVVVAVLPIVTATIRAIRDGWLPIGDNAYFALRSRDVFSSHFPLLGAWTSASRTANSNFNNPGPLYFDWLAIPVKLFNAPGIAAGVALLNIAAIVGIAIVAHRRGGPLVMTAAMAMAAGLSWTMGSELLFDPWQPHAMLMPFLLLLVLAWSLACGDLLMLPIAVGVGSFVIQTHLSYVLLVPALLLWGVGALSWTIWVRRRDDPAEWPDLRRRVRRLSLVSLAVFLACWAFPLLEEIQHGRDGNLSLIARSAFTSRETFGMGLGVKIVSSVVALPPWWMRPSIADTLATRANVPAEAGLINAPGRVAALLSLFVVFALLGGLLWAARRRADRTVVAAIGTAIIAVFVALLTAGTLPRGIFGVASHQLRFLWPISVFTMFVLAVAAARLLPRIEVKRVTAAFAVAVLVLAVLNLPKLNQGVGPDQFITATPSVRTLLSQLGPLEGRGPFLFDVSQLRFAESYSFAVMDDLTRRGVDILVDDVGLIRQLGNARRFTGHANGRLFLREGDAAVSDQGGAERVAIAYGLNPDEFRELGDLRSQIKTFLASGQLQLTEQGRREPPLPSDVTTLTDGNQIAVLLFEDALALDSRWRARFARYAELQDRWGVNTVALFLAPLST